MIELIKDMGFCMVPSLLVGGGIGWLILSMVKEKRGVMQIEVLEETLEARDHQFQILESNYMKQQQKINKLTDEGIVVRHQLLQKSNLLRKVSDELYKAQSRLEKLENYDKELKNLKDIIAEKNQTIEELEEVLMKADNLISKEEDRDIQIENPLLFEIEKLKKVIDQKDQQLKELEDKSRVRSEESFLITHDQFQEIEKRLIEYKEKIDILTKENEQLAKGRKGDGEIAPNRLLGKVGALFSRSKERIHKNIFDPNPLGKQQELKKI